MIEWLRGRRLTVGDWMIVLSIGSVVWALASPAMAARDRASATEELLAVVETVRAAAESSLEGAGAWPAPTAPGELPAELIGAFRGRDDLRYGRFTVEWVGWEVVDSVEAEIGEPDPTDAATAAVDDAPPDPELLAMQPVVRRIAGVSIHTSEPGLIPALMEHFGSDRSFVRDTTWTLVLPGREGGR